MNVLQQKITRLDTYAFNLCLGYSTRTSLSSWSRLMSRFGDGGFYLLLGISLALFEAEDGQRFFLTGLTAFAIELPLYLVLKNLIKRDRPCDRFDHFDAFIVPSDKFSFPSGHAAAAFVFATLISHFYPSLSYLSFGLAAMIGSARVMLGVHYPTDIVAGAVLGLASATVALNLYGVI